MVRWTRSMAPVDLRPASPDEALLDREPSDGVLELE
jgi:hypothetical protein